MSEAICNTSPLLYLYRSLRVLLEAKSHGLTNAIAPLIPRIQEAGLWMSEEIKQRILALAGEANDL